METKQIDATERAYEAMIAKAAKRGTTCLISLDTFSSFMKYQAWQESDCSDLKKWSRSLEIDPSEICENNRVLNWSETAKPVAGEIIHTQQFDEKLNILHAAAFRVIRIARGIGSVISDTPDNEDDDGSPVGIRRILAERILS